MLTEKETMRTLEHLKYLRNYKRELCKKKQQYSKLAGEKGFIPLLKKISTFVRYREFFQLDNMISEISAIITAYEDAVKPVKFFTTNDGHYEWLCISFSVLNSTIREEASRNHYPDKIHEIALEVEKIMFNVYERSGLYDEDTNFA